MTQEDIIKLLEQKRLIASTNEDLEKIEVLDNLLKEKNCFFKMNASVVVGVLSYLGIPEEKIVDTYFSLISPKRMLEDVPTERVIVSSDEHTNTL